MEIIIEILTKEINIIEETDIIEIFIIKINNNNKISKIIKIRILRMKNQQKNSLKHYR